MGGEMRLSDCMHNWHLCGITVMHQDTPASKRQIGKGYSNVKCMILCEKWIWTITMKDLGGRFSFWERWKLFDKMDLLFGKLFKQDKA